jgi:hypothetical protein
MRIVDHGAHTLRVLDLLKTLTVLHLECRRQRQCLELCLWMAKVVH